MGHMYSCYKASVLAYRQAVASRPSEQCKNNIYPETQRDQLVYTLDRYILD